MVFAIINKVRLVFYYPNKQLTFCKVNRNNSRIKYYLIYKFKSKTKIILE